MANIMQDRPRGGRLFFVANPDAEDGGSPTTAIPPPLPPPPPPLPSAPLPVPSTSHIVSPIQSPPLTTPTTAPLSVSVPVRSHAAVRLLPQITTNTASVPNAPPQPNHISSSGSSSDRSSPTFNTSASSPSPITPDSPHPVLQRRGLIVLATSDNSTWTTVNLSNASTGESVRELIYSALKVPDEDYDITSLYQGSITSGRIGDALSDEALLQICERMGDSEGNLRFALGKTSFPRSSAVAPPHSELSEPPYPRMRSGDIQIRDSPVFDGLNGYEASDESNYRRGGAQAGYSSRHARRDMSYSPPPSTAPQLGPYRGGASSSLGHYGNRPPAMAVAVPASRPHRALPQEPSPSRSSHSRTPSETEYPLWAATSPAPPPPGSWAGSPPSGTMNTAERFTAGLGIRRPSSSQGPRAPADWAASGYPGQPPVGGSGIGPAGGSGGGGGGSSPAMTAASSSSSLASLNSNPLPNLDTSVQPPPRNESREPLPMLNRMQQLSPSRLRPPGNFLQRSRLGPSPSSQAPLPPSNKTPFQIPFLHKALSPLSPRHKDDPSKSVVLGSGSNQNPSPSPNVVNSPSSASTTTATPASPNPPNPHPARPQPGGRRPSVPGTMYPPYIQPLMAAPRGPAPIPRPAGFSPRSPPNPTREKGLTGARSYDNLRNPSSSSGSGSKTIRPLPHGPASSSRTMQSSSLGMPTSQLTIGRQPALSSVVSPGLPPSRSGPGSAIGRRPNTAEPATTGLHRAPATHGGRPMINTSNLSTPGRMGSTGSSVAGGGSSNSSNSGNGVPDYSRSGDPATTPPLSSAVASAAPPPRGTEGVPTHVVRSHDMQRARSGSASSRIAPSPLVQSQLPQSPPPPLSLPPANPSSYSDPIIGPPAIPPRSPKRLQRPQLEQLLVPETSFSLPSRDSDGEPMSAAALAKMGALQEAQRRQSSNPYGYSPHSDGGIPDWGLPAISSDVSGTLMGTFMPGDHQYHLPPSPRATNRPKTPTPPQSHAPHHMYTQSLPDNHAHFDTNPTTSTTTTTTAVPSSHDGETTPRSRFEPSGSATNLTLSLTSTRSSAYSFDDDDNGSDSEDSEFWQQPKKPKEDAKWMVRPRTDALYDRLDNFFPEGILDEPVPDLIPSPTGNELSAVFPPISPTTATVHPRNDRSADEQEQPATGLSRSKQNRKSIRVVADEHRRNLKNLFSGSGKTAGGKAALGRRMTKLWGNRVEEMPPVPKLPHSHHHHQQDTVRPLESPSPASTTSTTLSAGSSSSSATVTEGNHKGAITFKWVRGRLIGKGSYGRVYYGLNATTGEVMAVKQVELPRTASDQIDKRQQNVISALRGESDTLSKLDHPNVVQYLGIEQTDDFLSIFLEYVSGGSIGFCTAKYGRFQEDIVKSFTKQISEGLAYLHESGILHRDLKGDNILIDPNGICKITDFGISRQADDIYAAATHTAMQGSICWMAPEVIQNPKRAEYSAKIDVWSLGCVVLEMWTGKRPWDGEWPVTVIYKLGTNREPPPVPENIRLNELADDFRRRCFAIDPDERPTAAELTTNPYLVLPSKWVFPGFPEPVGTEQSAGWTASMIQQP